MGALRKLGLMGLVAALALFTLPGASSAPQGISAHVDIEAGELPLIMSAPHGGQVRPAAVPDRTQAAVVNDWRSQELARELADEIETLTGMRPHLVINRLHRSKLDPNRSLEHGAQGSAVAARAWQAYHAGLEDASEAVVADCGWGLYVDLHSFGEWGRGIEIGYGLSHEALSEDDEDLSRRRFVYGSNLRHAALYSEQSLAELLRGPESLGGLLQARGYWAVPSPRHPRPDPGYFDGGYSVYRHGPQRGRGVDAVQIEVPYNLLRELQRERFVGALAVSLIDLLQGAYEVRPGASPLCPGFVDVARDHWALQSVRALNAAGRVDPCQEEPRRFCPYSELDRGQAAAIVWRALHGDRPARASRLAFVDVDSVALAPVAELWRRGYLDPCSTSPLRYCPERPMTRAAMAAVAVRVQAGAGMIPARPQGMFVDASASDWSTWWLEEAARRELLLSCDRGAPFGCPERTISRAEAAWMMARAMGLVR